MIVPVIILILCAILFIVTKVLEKITQRLDAEIKAQREIYEKDLQNFLAIGKAFYSTEELKQIEEYLKGIHE